MISPTNYSNNSNHSIASSDESCTDTLDWPQLMLNAHNANPSKTKYHTFHYRDHFFGSASKCMEQNVVEVHYTQTLCMALGYGNECSQEQSSWLKGFLVTKGYPSVLIESVDTLLEQAGELSAEEFLEDCELLASTFSGSAALSVVYDMMCAASVVGFRSKVQLQGVHLIAKAFKVADHQLEDVRYQCALEDQLRRHRIQQMFPMLTDVDHWLMMPRLETHMYLAHKKRTSATATGMVHAPVQETPGSRSA